MAFVELNRVERCQMSSVFNQMSMKARLMLSFTFMAAVVVSVRIRLS